MKNSFKTLREAEDNERELRRHYDYVGAPQYNGVEYLVFYTGKKIRGVDK